MSPEKGNKAFEGPGTHGLSEQAGVIQSGEEQAEGRFHCFLQIPEGRLERGGV